MSDRHEKEGPMKKHIALFDFDGTISAKDSFLGFIRYAGPRGRLLRNIPGLLPSAVGYFAGIIRDAVIKEKILTALFRGWTPEDFKTACRAFTDEIMPGILRSKALEKIRWHQENGHRVLVVSASPRVWLQPWCELEELELIATELEFRDGRFTGRLKGLNCHGPEKVRRVREAVPDLDEHYIYAYGDTGGDKPMLAMAHEAFYKPFRE